MTANAPPTSGRKNTKGELPMKDETKRKLSKPDMGKIVLLNFRVPASFKRDFKIAAARYGITQSELLQKVFEEWQEKYG
jgi:hypothetical protein